MLLHRCTSWVGRRYVSGMLYPSHERLDRLTRLATLETQRKRNKKGLALVKGIGASWLELHSLRSHMKEPRNLGGEGVQPGKSDPRICVLTT